MALTFDSSPVRRFLVNLQADASHAMWQLAVAAIAVALAWALARAVFHRIPPGERWRFGRGGFERVAFPLLAYVFVAVGRAVLAAWQPVALLDILAAALMAWIVIRIAVYMLGRVLPEGTFLRAVLRGVAWIAWIAVVLHVTGLAPAVIGTLDGIGFTSAKSQQRISLWLLAQGAAALALALAVSLWVARVTEDRVMASQTVDLSTRVVIAKLVRVAAVFLAILVALPMVGIDITALSIFGGALGVGLGFGLQKIAANYVSGFIVLLDRSLRIGDVVTVGDRRGEVKEIASRYTVIRGGDGIESIVPNEKLITEVVNHHSYSDPRVTVVLQVGVDYEADVDRACALLAEIARRDPRVLEDPAPQARVKSLGDFAVNLELVAWMGDLATGEADLRSVLYREILRTFRTEGIGIPYPRRDVRLIPTPETGNSGAPSSS